MTTRYGTQRDLVRERLHGALFGAILGDALGAPYMGWECVRPERFALGLERRSLHGTIASDLVLSTVATLLDTATASGSTLLRSLGDEPAPMLGADEILCTVREGLRLDAAERLLCGRIGVPSDLSTVFVLSAAMLAARGARGDTARPGWRRSRQRRQ